MFSYDATALVRSGTRLIAMANYSPWALGESLAFLSRNRTRFPFDKLVSHVFPIERITDAFQQAEWNRKGDPLRVLRAAISMS